LRTLETIFHENFEIIPATSPQLLEQVFRIRFEVLCLDKGIETFDQRQYPEGLEIDNDDERAQHYLVYHKESDTYAATVRLIFSGGQNDLTAFPMLRAAQNQVDMTSLATLPREEIAEISRLLIRKEFRTRLKKEVFTEGTYEDYKKLTREKRLVTHPIIGLLTAIMRMSSQNGIKYWFAGMEPSLDKRLRQLGLHLTPLGPMVNYHGRRRPYLGVIDDVINALYFNNRDIWRFITEQGKLWSPPRGLDKQPKQAG
jgi:N-acyl amino acid synthase of PEP-CTERM/exosortase system